MNIVIYLYDGMTALDAVGPYEVLSCLRDAEITFVAEQAGPVLTDTGHLSLVATKGIGEVNAADMLLVPGGPGDAAQMENASVLAWIQKIHATTDLTTSVCTGALILGAAGILEGKRATTYWSRLEKLSDFGAIPQKKRFVRDGKIITAAGVSAGIDMALALVADMKGKAAARAIRLGIEYYPRPPVWAPSPWLLPTAWRKAAAKKAEAFMARRMERRKGAR